MQVIRDGHKETLLKETDVKMEISVRTFKI